MQTPAEIERIAREQFNMVFPGEQVYDVGAAAATPTTTTDDRSLTAFRRLGGRAPAADSDVAALTELLGRAPRGAFEVVVRDADGRAGRDPQRAAARRRHADADALLARRPATSSLQVSRLEVGRRRARGGGRGRSPTSCWRAHERYAAERDAALPAIARRSAAARRRRRHAHAA